MKFFTIGFLLLGLPALCADNAADSSCGSGFLPSNRQGSACQLEGACAFDGKRTLSRAQCEVRVDVPNACVGKSTCPIVFRLHGSGGNNDNMPNSVGRSVHKYDFIGVYPQVNRQR